MCGRVVQARSPLQVAILCGFNVPDTRFANVPPRYNAAPSQELWAIRQNKSRPTADAREVITSMGSSVRAH
jgi:putative SOS response-associated peptidase YedK